MPITTMTSREFNQQTSEAKKHAQSGPVFITDRGVPAHVLLSIEEFQRITNIKSSIVDLLSMPKDIVLEFEAPKLIGSLRNVDF